MIYEQWTDLVFNTKTRTGKILVLTGNKSLNRPNDKKNLKVIKLEPPAPRPKTIKKAKERKKRSHKPRIPIYISSELSEFTGLVNCCKTITRSSLQRFGTFKHRLHKTGMDDSLFAILFYQRYKKRWSSVRWKYGMWKYRRQHIHCEQCEGLSSIVHHIVSASDGGKELYSNYIALCDSCHIKKHPELSEKFLITYQKLSRRF